MFECQLNSLGGGNEYKLIQDGGGHIPECFG